MVFQGTEFENCVLEKPFAEGSGSLPVLVDRELKPTFGTGINSVSPAHKVEDLKLSYAHNLSRNGCVDHVTGFLKSPAVLEGSDIYEDKETTSKIKTVLGELGQFYASHQHQCNEYRMTNLDKERVNLVTIDSWFAHISDKLKFKCFKELATVRFSPNLNLKSSEETAKDTEKLKKTPKGEKADIGSYYLNIAEELNDFNEWCISERGTWGIPIPYFERKDTKEILFDGEIARHVADVFRT